MNTSLPDLSRHLELPLPPFGRAMRSLFALDPQTRYLNHGGFGATPGPVLAVQRAWRDLIEANPTRFLVKEHLGPLLRQAAEGVARRFGGRGRDWVFTANASDGANAVLQSLKFAPGDEILITDHGYNALRQAALHVASRSGAVVRSVTLPWPDSSAEGVLAAIGAGLNRRTRLVMVDHIASPSALVLPVAEIAALVRASGADLLIDGAHVPGQLPLDVTALDADYYVGNLHKWAFVPRGCGVLWCRPERQAAIHPTTISHGYGQGFSAEFDWQGTRDFSAILACEAAFDLADRLGGFDAIAAYNRTLAARFAERLMAALDTNLATPAAMRGFSVTVALPAHHPATPERALALRQQLYEQHRIEAPIFPLAERLWLRVGAQIYLEPEDLPASIGACLRQAG